MTLASRLADVMRAVGADIKSLRARLAVVEDAPANSPVPVINGATRLIQTQKIAAQMVLEGQTQ